MRSKSLNGDAGMLSRINKTPSLQVPKINQNYDRPMMTRSFFFLGILFQTSPGLSRGSLDHGRWPTLIFRETRYYLHCFPHCRKSPILGSAQKNWPRVHLPTCRFVLLTPLTRAPIFADCQDFWHQVMAMTAMTC